jgi:hypothetical protein
MMFAVLSALFVAGVRLLMFHWGRPAEGSDMLFVHFMAIATIVFFTGKRALDEYAGTGIGDLLRDGFRNAAVYALITGVVIWWHYSSVEAVNFQLRVEAIVARELEQGHPEDVVRPRIERFFTPFNYASLTFFALLAAGAFNALVIGIIHHKFLRRLRR